MTATAIADVHIVGTAAVYFLYALFVPVALVVFVISRTSPRRQVRAMSRFETQLEPWLWHRGRTRAGEVFGGIAAFGALGCVVAFFLPAATYTEFPFYPGDPLAGVQEIEPTAKGLGLVIGIVVGLLSLRRALGGEGVSVAISFLLTTLLASITGLAVSDFISNAATGPSQYMSAVTAGPGLFILPAGAVVAWMAAAADLSIGIRESLRGASGKPPSPPPPSPRRRAVGTTNPEYSSAHSLARSIAGGVAVAVLVVFGWLPALFLILAVFPVAQNLAIQLYTGLRLRRPFRVDRSSFLVVAASFAVLVAVLGWALVRPDQVFAVPSSARHIRACGPSVTVPDTGNQVNRSIAGTTTVMSVGSKIYVEDTPDGRAALGALALDGPDVACAAGGSGFGEVVVGTKPGAATLYVRTNDNVTYRIQVQVNV